ncbi:MAG: SDR family NAD(P)-dependent oxidoreductase [Myxococcales bacterium]|nr:SDR family NAD(P)-dependent oxidoreductase [Myxococcales bacterium]
MSDELLMRDKVAVVTGAGRGIGRAIAVAFAQQGARVVVNDLGCGKDGTGKDPSPADEVTHEIIIRGGQATAHHGDASDAAQAQSLIDLATSTYGGLDVLVCMAGIARDKTALKMDEASFDAVYRNNVKSALLPAQAAARVFAQQRRGGHIVLCTSIAGLFGNYGQLNGAAASGAVYGMTRTLAIELKKQEVRVNAIAPVARTRMTDELPMFQGMPEESYGAQFVAPVAVFLSTKLCGELTGEVLSVAGAKVSVYRVMESEGAVLDDPRSVWDPREIARRFDDLSRL